MPTSLINGNDDDDDEDRFIDYDSNRVFYVNISFLLLLLLFK